VRKNQSAAGHIVAVANQKGGVGKTTLALHLGAAIARAGLRVIVADADTQGNASSWMLGQMPARSGFYDLFVCEHALPDVIQAVNGHWGLGLIPGNDGTAQAMTVLATLQRPFETIARGLRPLANAVDYVFIDMPPSKAAGFNELLFAADLILIPTQLERHSLEGVVFMAQACRDIIAHHGHGPRLLGIVPNMRRRNTRLHRRQHAALLQTFQSVVWPSIPESIAIADAASAGRVIFDTDPRSAAAQQLGLVARRLLENTGHREAIDGWQ